MTRPASVVIPVKGLRTGKSRLSRTLSEKERFKLNRHLVLHTLRTVSAAGNETDIYVVSPDSEVRQIADEFAVEFLLQESEGLNPALEWAARRLPDRRTVYIAADLPELETEDIRELIADTGIGICPDETRQGTNAFTVPTPRLLEFRFGVRSFEIHCELARVSDFELTVIDRPGLAFDLDTELDLSRMKGWPSSINPRSVRR